MEVTKMGRKSPLALSVILLAFVLGDPTAPIKGRTCVIAQGGAGCTTPSFARNSYPVSDRPRDAAAGDFNQDGRPDLAVATSDFDKVSVLLGQGNGTFGAATNFDTGDFPIAIVTGDFNADGRLDVVTANQPTTNNVSLLLGNGSGGLGAPTNFSVSGSPTHLAHGDFNGDSRLDLALPVFPNNVAILLGQSGGGFAAATNFTVGSSPEWIAVGDFNRDNRADLVTANFGSNNISILLGNGMGGFAATVNFNSGSSPVAIAVADFNADNAPDLAVVLSSFPPTFSIFLNTCSSAPCAAPSFAPKTDFTLANIAFEIAAGDFNLDGKQDLALDASSNVAILLGNGQGGFAPAANIPSPFNFNSNVTAADLNLDNKLDLVVTTPSSARVGVMLNTCGAAMIDALPTTLDFSNVTVGQSKDLPLTLRNTGNESLTVNSMTSNNANFTVLSPSTPFNIPGGGQQMVMVRYSPASSGTQFATLTIANTSPNSPMLTVSLRGTGVAPCSYAISPTSQVFSAGGGTGSVNVTTQSGCTWSATSNAGFISITSGANGTGNGMVGYSVAADPGMNFRSGTMTIAGRVFTVVQGTPPPGNWSAQTSGTTNDLRSVHFVDDNNGWVAGASATLLHTTNSGSSWPPVNTGVDAAKGFHSVRFLDGNIGWAAGTGAVARTLNGGSSWTMAVLPSVVLVAGNAIYNSFSFFSSTEFWTGGGGTLSGDPAAFVTNRSLDANGNLNNLGSIVTTPYPAYQDIHFTRERSILEGWVVGGGGTIRRLNLNSSTSFDEQTSGVNTQLNAIQMLLSGNNFIGFVVGNNGTILKTVNAGNQWVQQTSGTTANLRDVYFVNADQGWAVGDGGLILATNDGGANWMPEASGVSVDLFGVYFPNPGLGFAVGANGTILKRSTTTTIGALASVSAASYSGPGLSADSIVAAFGQSLATMTAVASTIPLPTQLAGTTVTVRDSSGTDRLASLFFVSSGQVNYLIPPGAALGPANVTIRSGSGAVSAGMVQIVTVAPGLFTANVDGQGVPAAQLFRIKANGAQSFEPVAQFDQAQGKFVPLPIDLGPEGDQVFLVLYGTGVRFRSSLTGVTETIGGANSEVLFADAAPGFIGLDQVNSRLARSLIGRGEVDVVLTVDGKPANTVRISIQ
jgi:uncharacterized protein (TIGR03437 family)